MASKRHGLASFLLLLAFCGALFHDFVVVESAATPSVGPLALRTSIPKAPFTEYVSSPGGTCFINNTMYLPYTIGSSMYYLEAQYDPDEFIYPLAKEPHDFLQFWVNHSECNALSPYSYCFPTPDEQTTHAIIAVLSFILALFLIGIAKVVVLLQRHIEFYYMQHALARLRAIAQAQWIEENISPHGPTASRADVGDEPPCANLTEDGDAYYPQAAGRGGLYELFGITQSDTMDWASDIGLLLAEFLTAQNNTAVFWALTHFLNMRAVRADSFSLKQHLEDLGSRVKDMVNDLKPDNEPEVGFDQAVLDETDVFGPDYEPQALYDDLIEGATRISSLFKGERGNRLMQAFILVVSAATFATSGSLDLSKLDLVKKYWADGSSVVDNLDMFTTCVESLKWVATAGWQSYVTGTTDPFFFSQSSLTEWVRNVNTTLAMRDHLTDLKTYVNYSDPTRTKDGINDLPSLRTLVIKLLNDSGPIRKHMALKQKNAGVKMVDDYVTSLRGLLCRVELAIKSAKCRPSPFGCAIYGFTGIRKTAILEILARTTLSVAGIENTENSIYYRNQYEQYWSGLEHSKGHIIVFDDMAAERAEKMAGVSVGTADLIATLNNVPHCPNMAEAGDKGKVSINALAVFITTNVFDLNLPFYFSTPVAVRRRIPITIEVLVKEKYATPDTRALRADKRMLDTRHQAAPGELPDFWHFKVSKVVGEDQRKSVKHIQVLDTRDPPAGRFPDDFKEIDMLVDYYAEQFKAHNEAQMNFMAFHDRMEKMEFCNTCRKLESMPCPTCFVPPFENLSDVVVDTRETDDADEDFSSCTSEVSDDGSYEDPPDEDDYAAQSYESVFQAVGVCWVLYFIVTSFLKYWRRARIWYELGREYALARVDAWFRSAIHYTIDIVGAETALRFNIITPVAYFAHFGRSFDRAKPYMVSAMYTAVTVGTIYTVYKMFKRDKYQPNADNYPNMRRDHPPNPWLVKRPVPAASKVSNTSRGVVGCESIVTRVRRNLVHLELTFELEGVVKACSLFGLGLDDEIVMTNAHLFRMRDGKLRTSEGSRGDFGLVYKLKMRTFGAGITLNDHYIEVPVGDVVFSDKKDLAFFRCRSRRFQSLIGPRNSVFTDNDVSFGDGFYLRPVDGKTDVIMQCVPKPPNINGFFVLADKFYSTVAKVGDNLADGECGLPLLVLGADNVPIVAGNHTAGCAGGKKGLATMVTHDEVVELVRPLRGIRGLTGGLVNFSNFEVGDLRTTTPVVQDDGTYSPKEAVVVTPSIHPKSVFMHEHGDGIDGPYNVLGGLSAISPSGSLVGVTNMERKVAAKESPLAPYMAEIGFEPKHTAPLMEGFPPQREMLKRMRGKFKGNDELLTVCAEAMIEDIKERVGDRGRATCGVLDDVDNMNGVPGSRLPGIDRTKSAGAHVFGNKRALCVPYNDDPFDDRVLPNDGVLGEVADMEAGYDDGRTTGVLWTVTWKCELVSLAKRAANKTRAIFFAPFAFLFLVRKYFGALSALIQTYAFEFETAWGVNAQGRDWQRVFDHLTKFGDDRILAGDYVAYDLSAYMMHSIMLCFAILIHLNMFFSSSFSERDQRMMWGIAHDSVAFYVNFFGTLIFLCGLLASGHSLTTVINGLNNSLNARAGWVIADLRQARLEYTRANAVRSLAKFRRLVVLLTYGDDHVMGICESVRWFSASVFAECLRSYDIGYTGTVKGAPIPEVLASIFQETFLKRHFLKIADDFVRAPLELASLVRSAMQSIDSGLSSLDHAREVIVNVHSGAAQHERSVFDMFDRICRKADEELMLDCARNFLTYDEYYRRCYDI